MAILMPLVQQMAISGMMRSHSSSRLVGTGTLLIVASLAFAVSGLVFGLLAEYIWLKTFVSPQAAALTTSVSAFALSLLFFGIREFVNRRKKKALSVNHPADITQTIGKIIGSLGDELDNPIRENPKIALMLAGLAGFMAADRRI